MELILYVILLVMAAAAYTAFACFRQKQWKEGAAWWVLFIGMTVAGVLLLHSHGQILRKVNDDYRSTHPASSPATIL